MSLKRFLTFDWDAVAGIIAAIAAIVMHFLAMPKELMEAVWVAAEMRAGGAYAHSTLMLSSTLAKNSMG